MVIDDGSAGAEIVIQETGEIVQLTDYLTPALEVINEQFPTDDSYTFMAEIAMSAYATLMLRMDGCVAVIFEGPPSTNKTTVLNMFATVDLTFRLDDFTPASFVTMTANKTATELAKIDLLPRIQHRVLVSPDLAPLMSKKNADNAANLGVLTRVLDGTGYMRSAGTSEPRGYEGDYRFVLLGATTPITKSIHEQLAQLGNRLLLAESGSPAVTNEELHELLSGGDIGHKVEACQGVIKHGLESAWEDVGGYAHVVPDADQEDSEILDLITDLARVIAYGRSFKDEDLERVEGLPRTVTRLRALGNARALLNGRYLMNRADVQMLARLAIGSLPIHRRRMLLALIRSLEDVELGLMTTNIMELLNCSRDTAIARIKDFGESGLGMTGQDDEMDNTWYVVLHYDYRWLCEEEYLWLTEKLN